jgi:hypothetical protein
MLQRRKMSSRRQRVIVRDRSFRVDKAAMRNKVVVTIDGIPRPIPVNIPVTISETVVNALEDARYEVTPVIGATDEAWDVPSPPAAVHKTEPRRDYGHAAPYSVVEEEVPGAAS